MFRVWHLSGGGTLFVFFLREWINLGAEISLQPIEEQLGIPPQTHSHTHTQTQTLIVGVPPPLHMHRPSNNHSPNIRPPSGNALQFTAIRSNFLHKSTQCVRIVQVQLPPSPAIPNQLPIVNYPLPDCSIPSIIVRSLPLQSIPNISFHSNRSAFPPEKNSWQLFPFGSAAGQKEMLFVRLNRTGGPSFTVKCAIVRDYIVGRHKSFCVNSLHHNTPPT